MLIVDMSSIFDSMISIVMISNHKYIVFYNSTEKNSHLLMNFRIVWHSASDSNQRISRRWNVYWLIWTGWVLYITCVKIDGQFMHFDQHVTVFAYRKKKSDAKLDTQKACKWKYFHNWSCFGTICFFWMI